MVIQIEITLPPFPRGFHLISRMIEQHLPALPPAGMLHLFIKHTSAGLTINENADATVRMDFETVLERLVPEGKGFYVHTMEGPDDMPAHVKATLVGSSVTVPITNGKLNLGTWQGIYLCEFRNHGGKRKLTATIYS